MGRVQPRRALEMLLVGKPISAAEAERIGLANRVVPDAELAAETAALAGAIATTSKHNTGLGKRGFYEALAEPTAAARYAVAGERMLDMFGSNDQQEGIAAFLEKRNPKWTDS